MLSQKLAAVEPIFRGCCTLNAVVPAACLVPKVAEGSIRSKARLLQHARCVAPRFSAIDINFTVRDVIASAMHKYDIVFQA